MEIDDIKQHLKFQLLLECKSCKKMFLLDKGKEKSFVCDNCGRVKYNNIKTYGYIPTVGEMEISGNTLEKVEEIMKVKKFSDSQDVISYAIKYMVSMPEDELEKWLIKSSESDVLCDDGTVKIKRYKK